MSTMPTRVDIEVFEAARSAASASSRSATQQINHWARIGRAFEEAPSTTVRDIQRVLSGELPYDALSEPAQSVVRASWDEAITEAIGELDLAAEFQAAGTGYAEADEQGNLVDHPAHSPAADR